jgi:hypothetical protein
MTPEASDKRKDRLAAALKENLRRRKTQARAKATMSPKAKGLGADLGRTSKISPKPV